MQVATSQTQHLPKSYLIKFFWSQNQQQKQNQNKTFWLILLLLILLVLIISDKDGVKVYLDSLLGKKKLSARAIPGTFLCMSKVPES